MSREVLDNQMATAIRLIELGAGSQSDTELVGFIRRAINCLGRAEQEADFRAEQSDRLEATGQKERRDG